MAKDRIIRALGEDELLPPALVGRALDANDRVKYLLTLLQTARAWADGDRSVSDLREERLASGVADASLDAVVAASVRRDADSYVIPGAEDLTRRAFEEVDTMLAPLRVEGDGSAKALGARVAALRGAVRPSEDIIAPEDVTRLAAGPRDGRDSLHLVVVDGHREFNRLQGRLATESIDGALAHDLAERDRPLVRAFARGVLRTEGLRFGHPGLETVATRSGDALVIQNEIGETEAHVLVVRVVGAEVTVTYTDVHLSRLLFFQRLFEGRGVRWDDTRSRSEAATREGLYHLAVGRVRSTSVAGLEEFLRFLGSRIVFLIDWNRARKRVRSLVGNRAAIELLTWAAEREYGHMAFLRAGGDELVPPNA